MSLKHLTNGSRLPLCQPNVLRLYSMHFCPYAQRTRLVLAHKNIKHELINVNLKFKPDWFIARNPLGLVPILELNENVVYESEVCDDLLEELYPQNPLYPKDPFEKAQQKQLMSIFVKVTDALNAVKSRDINKKKKGIESIASQLGIYEKALKFKFFAGDSPGMVDYHIWPWFERMPALTQLTGIDLLTEDKHPLLNQWIQRMLQLPAVKESWLSTDLHVGFFISLANRDPNYDAAFVSANL